MSRSILLFLFIVFVTYVYPQNGSVTLEELHLQKEKISEKLNDIDDEIEQAKLRNVISNLKAVGLPTDDFIQHSAMMLSYSEEHEQANWVAHIITPDVLHSSISRTNDFRVDPLVKTGTAIKEDYFIEIIEVDSTIVYDGFGYDRGHLAPSADFRWSLEALSESYFYSNMSPQLPNFNREKWGELESHLRGYLYAHTSSDLYVVTLPVLRDDLPVIERGVNKVSIPYKFVKVVMDLKEQQGIAFVMENRKLDMPLYEYAMNIDAAEVLTGYDFFNKLDDKKQASIEANYNERHWFPEFVLGNVKPIRQPSMPRGYFNTINAKIYAKQNEKITVCGTVVSGRYSKKKNAMLQLDQKYPDEIFTVFIPKDKVINFSFDPVIALKDKCYCFKGTIDNFMGHPSMNVERESYIEEYLGTP